MAPILVLLVTSPHCPPLSRLTAHSEDTDCSDTGMLLQTRCPLVFRGLQEMLVFLVAMVCIVYIPHLLESYRPEEQLPGVAEGTCAGSKAERREKRVRMRRGTQQLSAQATTCLRCLRLPEGSAFPQMEADPTNKVTTVCSKTGLISIYKLGDFS